MIIFVNILSSGYFAQTKQILIRSLGGEMVDYNPEHIIVDDTTLDHFQDKFYPK